MSDDNEGRPPGAVIQVSTGAVKVQPAWPARSCRRPARRSAASRVAPWPNGTPSRSAVQHGAQVPTTTKVEAIVVRQAGRRREIAQHNARWRCRILRAAAAAACARSDTGFIDVFQEQDPPLSRADTCPSRHTSIDRFPPIAGLARPGQDRPVSNSIRLRAARSLEKTLDRELAVASRSESAADALELTRPHAQHASRSGEIAIADRIRRHRIAANPAAPAAGHPVPAACATTTSSRDRSRSR